MRFTTTPLTDVNANKIVHPSIFTFTLLWRVPLYCLAGFPRHKGKGKYTRPSVIPSSRSTEARASFVIFSASSIRRFCSSLPWTLLSASSAVFSISSADTARRGSTCRKPNVQGVTETVRVSLERQAVGPVRQISADDFPEQGVMVLQEKLHEFLLMSPLHL